ncbi:MAG: helix-turn-helix domain-containing protein [Candidatus Binatus sp.]
MVGAGLSWLRIVYDLVHFLCLGLRSRTSLAAENLFLRKQLAFYQERKVKPRRADNPTRLTLVLLSRWFDWRDALVVVRPRTLVAWHRNGFRLFWRWKSEVGRPPISLELQHLIRKMARENPSWGEERIANELLLKLGLRVSPRTMRKYMPKLPATPPGGPRGDQRWATFLKNHARVIIACDFCVVVTATFRILYVFVAMEHASRRLIHLNATTHPTAAWTLQQLREAIPSNHEYRFIIHDHDRIFSAELNASLTHLGLKVITTPVRSPQAELALRTADRDSAAGVPRLDHSDERRAFEETSGVLDGPLQPRQTTFLLGTGCSRSTCSLPARSCNGTDTVSTD